MSNKNNQEKTIREITDEDNFENGIPIYEMVNGKVGGVKRLTDEYLIYKMKQVHKEHGEVKTKYFTKANDLPSSSVYTRRFGSFQNAIKIAGLNLTEEQKHYTMSRNMTDEELLEELRRYSREIGFPTGRGLSQTDGFLNAKAYYNRFGSLKNAILLAGLEIPQSRLKDYDRESLSDEEMLFLLKHYTDKKLKTELTLLTYDEIEKIKEMPSSSTYVRRFGTLEEAYKLIGIDHEDFNNKRIKDKMIEEYHQLAKELGKTPHSRDLERASLEGKTSSASSYLFHFGSMDKLRMELGYEVHSPSKYMSDEEVLKQLWELGQDLGGVPSKLDVDNRDDVVSSGVYTRRFANFANALLLAGYNKKDINSKIKTTGQGNVCYSRYEYLFCKMLENYNYSFVKEARYSDYIHGYDKVYSCDFVVQINDIDYFVEVFGITSVESYYKRTQEKIDICKENNIPLIEIYPEDIWGKRQEELKDMFEEKVRLYNL